jgi:hypothetical protein
MSKIRRGVRFLLLGLPCLVLLLWAWSYFETVDIPVVDTLHCPQVPKGGELFVHPSISEGRLRIRYCRVVPNAPLVSYATAPRLGFAYQHVTDTRYQAGIFVEKNFYAPVWSVLLVTLLFPVHTAFLWWLDRRRIPPGHCQTCGYNLTGNVSGVCPECGTNVTRSKTDQPPDPASRNGIN